MTTSDIPTVIVKLEHVLENVNHELLQIGAWLNVVGHVEKPQGVNRNGTKRNTHSPGLVAATMIWSAGAMKLDRYESAVQGYQKPLVPG